MKRVAIDDLPDDPLGAGGVFRQHWLAHVETLLASGEDVTLVFAPADYTHAEWRRVVTAALARKFAPRRVNAIAGEGEAAAAVEAYLASAPGVTGQYLECA